MGILDNAKKQIVEQVIWAEKELVGKSGADKKKAVIKKLDDLIKLPAYLEWVDDIVISSLVDQACEKLNNLTAHNFKDAAVNEVDKANIAGAMEVQK